MACTNPSALLGVDSRSCRAAHRDSRRQGRSRGPHVGAAARDGDGRGRAESRGLRAEHRSRCASASSRACASPRSTTARSASSGARPPGTAEALTEDDFAHVADWRTLPRLLRAGTAGRSSTRSGSRSITTASTTTFFARLRAEYTDAEILDLTVCIGGWLALGRTMHVLGLDDLPIARKIAGSRQTRVAFRHGRPRRSTPRSTAATAATRRSCRATGRSGARTAATSRRSRCAPRARTRASTGRSARRALPRRRRLRRRRRPRGHDACARPKRAESIRVSMTQRGQPIFDAMVWTVGDVDGLEHDVSRDARACPSRSRCRRPRSGSAEAGIEPMFRFWAELRRAAGHLGRRLGEPASRARRWPAAGTGSCPRSTFDDPWVDACRSLILLDTLGWPAVCQPARRQRRTSRRASTSRSRSTAPGPTSRGCTRRRRRSSANAGVIGCEGEGLGARRRAARGRRQPAPLPPRCRRRSIGAVEDRITPGLYLEMTDHAARRVRAPSGCPTVLAPARRASGPRGGATCTATATDLPRVLPEFDHLGVYEVDDDVPRAADARRRSPATTSAATAGPGQGVAHRPADDRAVARADLAQGARRGRRSCATGPTSCTSATSPRPRCPGYAMITPYENVTGGDPRFMHFYEMDTDDPETRVQGDDAARDGAHRRRPTPTRSSTGRSGRACASCTSTRSSASAQRRA